MAGKREIRSLERPSELGSDREEGKNTPTHQLKVLNATDEVGCVGPPALYVHTICGREREKVLKDLATSSQNFNSNVFV